MGATFFILLRINYYYIPLAKPPYLSRTKIEENSKNPLLRVSRFIYKLNLCDEKIPKDYLHLIACSSSRTCIRLLLYAEKISCSNRSTELKN